MKAAARLLPPLQPLRLSARPICATALSRSTAIAGPSRFASTAAARYASTSTSNVAPSPSSAPPVAAVGDAAEGLSREAEADGEGEEIPSNVTFEELSEEADEDVDWALAQQDASHFPTLSETGSFNPILLPVSSLASPTPTLPADSDLVVSLPPDVFAQPIRRDILHRCVVWYLSTLRSGTKTTKSRSTVNYSGRKLRPQKGTGRARIGDASSGVLRGGAPIFPINPKNWAQSLPRKVRALGMRTALSSKLSSGLLRVVQDLNEGGWQGTNDARRALSDKVYIPVPEGAAEDMEPILSTSSTTETISDADADVPSPSSTAVAAEVEAQIIHRFGPSKELSILFLHSPSKNPDELDTFTRNVRNIPGVEVMSTDEVEVYHVLKYKWLVVDGEAVDALSGVEMWDAGESVWPDAQEVGEQVGELGSRGIAA